jgi:preprotein translocase subunit YajC
MEYASLLPLLALLVLFWLLVIRPASRRQKAVQKMQAEVTVGQRVMLASGIFGTIQRLDDDRVHLEIAPGVEVEAMRAAISGVDERGQQADVALSEGDRDADADGTPGEETR